MHYLRTLIFITIIILIPAQTHAEAIVHNDLRETVRAEVLAVSEASTREIVGTDTTVTVETVTIRLLEGEQTGSIKDFENEMISLSPGQTIFVNRVISINGDESIVLMDVDRRSKLALLGAAAIGLIIFFARWQGVRALVSLGLSIGAITFILVPALLRGYDPALTSLVVAGCVLAAVLFITHGINPRSVAAFVGTWSAVIVTCLIAFISVRAMQLSGFSSDAAVFLNFATQGQLDFAGLLLGSIIIGLLGVLDDVSITQASVVQELKAANPALEARDLYKRAIRVGRDHVGSLVNTLALAYVGVSLPLILLYARADTALSLTINQEIVAAELVRIIIGSMGLILAVPLTTAAAAWYFGKQSSVEECEGHHCGHHH